LPLLDQILKSVLLFDLQFTALRIQAPLLTEGLALLLKRVHVRGVERVGLQHPAGLDDLFADDGLEGGGVGQLQFAFSILGQVIHLQHSSM